MQPTVRSTFVLILASFNGALFGCGDERPQPEGSDVEGQRLVACDPWNQAGTARNLPALTRVEYAAQVEPDDHLVVLGPEDLESYDDYVLFFGPSDRVSQREVQGFGRGRDGGTTTIFFDLDGETARAHFPNRIQRDGPPITEPVTFDVDGSPRAITKLPRERASVDGLSFECLR